LNQKLLGNGVSLKRLCKFVSGGKMTMNGEEVRVAIFQLVRSSPGEMAAETFGFCYHSRLTNRLLVNILCVDCFCITEPISVLLMW